MPDDEVVELQSNRKRKEVQHDPRFGKSVQYKAPDTPKSSHNASQINDLKENDHKPKKTKKRASGANGGVISAKTEEEKKAEAKRKKDFELSQERISKLNECADFMLSCLEPSFKEDWIQAAQEQRVKDIGMYLLGVLNRLSKMVDYMEYDIEPEWEQGFVGYNEHLFCEYCGTEIAITRTTHLKQRFCSNLCAKRYKEMHSTGIVFPNERPGPSEQEIEEHKWMQENKRNGVLTVDG